MFFRIGSQAVRMPAGFPDAFGMQNPPGKVKKLIEWWRMRARGRNDTFVLYCGITLAD